MGSRRFNLIVVSIVVALVAGSIYVDLIKETKLGLDLSEGARVAVLVNGLGATPPEELYLIYRRVHLALADRGVKIHRRYIGEYATSLEMAGFSVTLLRLDDDLARWWDAPVHTPALRWGA